MTDAHDEAMALWNKFDKETNPQKKADLQFQMNELAQKNKSGQVNSTLFQDTNQLNQEIQDVINQTNGRIVE